jgi:diguanylate cyclase (GGDEF)-like protein
MRFLPGNAIKTLLLALCWTVDAYGVVAPQAPPAGTTLQLVEAAESAFRMDIEQARQLAEQAIERLRRTPDSDLEARARLVLCEYYSEQDSVAATREADAVAALTPPPARTGLRAGLLTCRGEIQEAMGENEKALSLYDQAVAAATSTQDNEMLAEALYARGFLASLRGNYANSLSDLRRSQQLFDGLNMPLRAMTTLNGVATTLGRIGDNEQALKIYRNALQMQQQLGLQRDQLVTQHNIGRVAEKLARWDVAAEAFQASLAISRDLKYARGEAYALRGLSATATARGQPNEALTLLATAAELQKKTPDVRLKALIDLAHGMALSAKAEWPQARTHFSTALELFRSSGALNEQIKTYESLALVDAELGDWRRAFQWQQAAKANSEQMLRNQINQQFSTLKVEFDLQASEREINVLRRESLANRRLLQESRRARNLQYIITGLVLLSAVLLAAIALRHTRNSRRMQALAHTDELTGVPNRRSVLSMLPAAMQRNDGHGNAVMIVDIDHFKLINDSFGHATGDRILQLVASVLRGALHEPEFFGRIGGEEFLIVSPGIGLPAALARAEALRLVVRDADCSVLIPELQALTVSVGVAVSRPEDSTNTILQRADAALYRAKAEGRNRVVGEMLRREHANATFPISRVPKADIPRENTG